MPAVIEALVRRAVQPETPARLRLWVTVAVLTAVALLATTSLLMSRVREQVRIIGDEAAPQAATAADLYFALSDMDAQVARLVLTAGSDELAGSQIDALGIYRERSRQVDADLQRALTTSSSAAERAIVLDLLGHLAVYRERVWQALTAGDAAAGYYTQATNVLHLDLLPAASRLRDTSEERLGSAYGSKSVTEVLGGILALVLGAALILQLVGLQVWLARRFRRMLNPALLAATAITFALVVPAAVVFSLQGSRLAAARSESLDPLLALSRARAVSYDAAADTSRFLISDNLSLYDEDFARKSDCLAAVASPAPSTSCGAGLAAVASGAVAERWAAYERDHSRIVGLARSGREDEAIRLLTGIRRGDAAFDFAYYDAAVGAIAADRERAYADALRSTSALLRGWAVIPLVAMGVVLLLVPLSVRKRLAEYR